MLGDPDRWGNRYELPEFQIGAKRSSHEEHAQWFQCGHCKRRWDNSLITSLTPTPSARCPFEYEHEYPEEPENPLIERLEILRGKLAGPATTLSFLAAEDPEGDAVRWSDLERIFEEEIESLR